MRVYLLIFGLSLLHCGGDRFIALPDVSQAKSWVVIAPSGGQFFAADQPGDFFDDLDVAALPFELETMGLTPSVQPLGPPRGLSVLQKFEHADGQWSALLDATVSTPFAPSQCNNRCIATHRCPECASQPSMLGCGVCELSPVAPPEEPTRDCPNGWASRDDSSGHHACFVEDTDGLLDRCAPGTRWSMTAQACVALTVCTSPALPPDSSPIYVDPLAASGGDGSLAAPLQQVPTLSDGATVVLLPGDHPPFRITADDVSVLGHGQCSVVVGTSSAAISVAAPGAHLQGLVLSGEGPTASLEVALGASVRAVDVRMQADETAVVALGSLTVEQSYLTRNSSCTEPECPGLLFVTGSLTLDDVDVEADAAVLSLGDLRLRQVRLRGQGGPAFAVDCSGDAAVEMSEVAVVNHGAGIYLNLTSTVVPDLSDVLVALAEHPNVPRHTGIRFDSSMVEAQLKLRRVEIRSPTIGLWLQGTSVDAEDLHILAGAAGIVTQHTLAAARVTKLTRAWFDYGEEAIFSLRNTLDLTDVWMQRLSSGPTDTNGRVLAAITPRLGDVVANRLHIVDRSVGLINVLEGDLTDLTVLGYVGAAVTTARGEVGPDGVLRGRRWRLQGASFGFYLKIDFDLEDISISSTGITACIDEGPSGSITRFSLDPRGSEPAIGFRKGDGDSTGIDGMRFRDGEYFATEFADFSDNCLMEKVPLQQWPAIDNVVSTGF